MRNIFGEERKETCLIVGSNMDALPDWGEESTEVRTIKRKLHFAIMQSIQDGYMRFIVVPQWGVGLWAAETVLAIRRILPFIELEVIVAPDTEYEGELDEYDFDELSERKDNVHHRAKSCYMVTNQEGQDCRELMNMVQPGLMLLFACEGDSDLEEMAQWADENGYKTERH